MAIARLNSGYIYSLTSSASGSFDSGSTGADRGLLVFVFSANATSNATVTYNGVPLTLNYTRDISWTTQKIHIFSIANPTAGSNTLAVSGTSATMLIAMAISYSGVDQTNFVEATGYGENNGTTLNLSVTTATASSWTASMTRTAAGTSMSISSGTQTLIAQSYFNGYYQSSWSDSNSAIASPSSQSVQYSTSGSSRFDGVIAALKPATTTPTFRPHMMLI